MRDVDQEIIEAIALKVMPPEMKARIRALTFGERGQLLDRVREALAREATSRIPLTSV
jgi:hypothetical protein